MQAADAVFLLMDIRGILLIAMAGVFHCAAPAPARARTFAVFSVNNTFNDNSNNSYTDK